MTNVNLIYVNHQAACAAPCIQTKSPATKLIHINEAIFKMDYKNRDAYVSFHQMRHRDKAEPVNVWNAQTLVRNSTQ